MTAPNIVSFPWASGTDMIVMIDPSENIPNGEIIKTEVETTTAIDFDADYPIGAVYPNMSEALTAALGVCGATLGEASGEIHVDASGALEALGEAFERIGAAANSATWKRAPGAQDDQSERYIVTDQRGETIVGAVKTFAFAKSAALRWSDQIDEPVTVMQLIEQGLSDFGNGRSASFDVWKTVEVVDAPAMGDESFDEAALSAELDRLLNAAETLRKIRAAVNQSLNDVDRARKAIGSMASIEGSPTAELASIARGYADDFDTRAWNVLITEADETMIGELRAFE